MCSSVMYIFKKNTKSNEMYMTCMTLPIATETTVFFLRINPITGRWEEAKMNPTDEMSDDQKEYEAMRLVNDLDKLQRYEFSNTES